MVHPQIDEFHAARAAGHLEHVFKIGVVRVRGQLHVQRAQQRNARGESGTESVIRIMLEGRKTGVITEYANNIADKLVQVINTKTEKELETEKMLRELRDETENGLSVLPELKS